MRKIEFRGYCKTSCGHPIFSRSPKAKYCSLQCFKARFRINRQPCRNCGGPLSLRVQKYCSNKCQHDYQFKQRLQAFHSGTPPAFRHSNSLKRIVVSILGERCTNCGWAERHPVTGRVPIELEHIDGNWENNDPSNLTLLCPNCHSLTPTFRALKRGRGRPFRLGGRGNPLRQG